MCHDYRLQVYMQRVYVEDKVCGLKVAVVLTYTCGWAEAIEWYGVRQRKLFWRKQFRCDKQLEWRIWDLPELAIILSLLRCCYRFIFFFWLTDFAWNFLSSATRTVWRMLATQKIQEGGSRYNILGFICMWLLIMEACSAFYQATYPSRSSFVIVL